MSSFEHDLFIPKPAGGGVCAECGSQTERTIAVAAPEGYVPKGGWKAGDLPLVRVHQCAPCAQRRYQAQARAVAENPEVLPHLREAMRGYLAENALSDTF